MDTKPLIHSKTFWLGLGEMVFGATGLVFGWLDSQAAGALIVAGFGMIGLRVNTSQPIGGIFRS